MKDDTITFIDNRSGKKHNFRIKKGSSGPDVVDLTSFFAKTGMFIYDPGFTSTASCSSQITYIDGEKGTLLHRGYKIEDLAEKSDYPEVCYLLLNGELPSKENKERFISILTHHTMLHEQILRFYSGFRRDSHPMAVMVGIVGALSSFYSEKIYDFSTTEGKWVAVSRLLAKLPTMAAMAYKYSLGQPFIYPKNNLSYAENFLHMMFSTPCGEYKPSQASIDALDKLLILHADHEQNCSASTVRIVGSSHASLYASISAGINALWGPLHGGANQAVIEMLELIKNDDSDIDKYISKAKDKSDPFRLMGFGHRVYKNFDPRAKIIKKAADQVLNDLGINDPVLDIAKSIEEKALNDEYFIEKKLYPNVDFYSGIIYRALGIPTEMFTVMFALGRIPGWIAQWKEMRDSNNPIGRPRQIYNGPKHRTIS